MGERISLPMSLTTANSPHTVGETVDKLVAALERRGINVFGRVDHAAGARKVGEQLADEQVLIFGDPRVGTALMQDDAEIGYELPLRLLVWDADGQTTIAYRPPVELGGEYHVAAHADVLERMGGLLEQLVAEGTATD